LKAIIMVYASHHAIKASTKIAKTTLARSVKITV
jgi:hypothetical protein